MGRFIVAGLAIGLAAVCWGAPPVETGGSPDPAKWGNRPPETAKTQRPSQAGPLEVTAFGGMIGDASAPFRPHQSGDEFEYSENVIVQYREAPDPDSFKAHFSIEPPTAVSMYFGGNYGKNANVSIRKTPGVTYTLKVAAGVQGKAGGSDPQEHLYKITTAAKVPEVEPLRATPDEPYRYGTLGHPFPFSLGGKTADRQIQALAEAGIRYVRMEYIGDQSNPQKGVYRFDIQDKILDKLLARGITELASIDQYSPAKWANRGKNYPNIWEKPEDFAAFAGALARHLAEKYPKVTRIEIFNEPNLTGWWTHPDPSSPYADRSGKACAAYMIAAYRAIKQANPNFIVVGPALANGGSHTESSRFMENMYRAGVKQGNGFDVLSVHNYGWFNPDTDLGPKDKYEGRFDCYKDVQAVCAAHGDKDVHVMLTEWGYSNVEDKAQGFDPRVQAYYLGLGLNRMLRDPSVDGVTYVNIYNPATDFWGQTSLVDKDFKPYPGFRVFQKFAK